MRLPDAVRRFILAVLPWYHAAEVEARHARSQAVIDDSRHSIEHAAEVATGERRAAIRASAHAIAERLDGNG